MRITPIPGRSLEFHQWLLTQPPSVVAQITRAEREYLKNAEGRALLDAAADAQEGYCDTGVVDTA